MPMLFTVSLIARLQSHDRPFVHFPPMNRVVDDRNSCDTTKHDNPVVHGLRGGLVRDREHDNDDYGRHEED